MWEILKDIGIFVVLWIVFLVVVYVSSGVQARAWLDVFDKYFSDKFNKK